jgi:nucleoid-associated protein YgaU
VNQIGLKLADGSFYPVLEEGFSGRKRLILTTVRDNQDAVQIDLYRGEGTRVDETEYVGSLSIENIRSAPKNDPDVELILFVDENGSLEAAAADLQGGDRKQLSVQLGPAGAAESPQFDLEREGAATKVKRDTEELREELLTGETYPIGPEDRRKEHLHRRKRRPLLLVAFVLLALILIAAIAFVVFRSVNGQRIPPLFGSRAPAEELRPEADTAGKVAGEGEAAAAQEATASEGVTEGPETQGPETQSRETQGRVADPGASTTERAAVAAGGAGAEADISAGEAQKKTPGSSSAGGVWYNIKRGDTLWDIAATYYRNPWLYPKLARANKIVNPDLIFAGNKLFIPEP